MTGTVTTNRGTYSITFNIPVSPTKVTYEDQYPEPVAYGNTYRYYVQVPSGYSSYYVLGTPNQATEPNWTLTGTCTLYVIATNNYTYGSSYGMYYSGAITVSQTNYNINYNGVAGETVQFAQSDFNDFMNKVAEARGDASKTKSYPYVTFDYVTFSLPTTAQGTLYYGGTAMSTSNSSGAFNRNTKVTNLDSVTFVPNAKSTAKTITLFQLHHELQHDRAVLRQRRRQPRARGHQVHRLSGRQRPLRRERLPQLPELHQGLQQQLHHRLRDL